jgi:shikimate kinase
LSGSGDGPRLSVALDRRASCRVEPIAAGVELESKESLTAQARSVLGAPAGLRVVTEWKLPAGSGIQGDAALALATTAAVSRALGREQEPAELIALAREVAARAGRTDAHGLHAALWGGLVVTRSSGEAVQAERLMVDPGRIDEALLVVDAGAAPELDAGAEAERLSARSDSSITGRIVEALRQARYEEVVDLVAEEASGAVAGPAQRRIVEIVRAAGGAARPLGAERLVAVWAPPGARGAGRQEAVQAALKAAGFKPLAVRVDLRGLELD